MPALARRRSRAAADVGAGVRDAASAALAAQAGRWGLWVAVAFVGGAGWAIAAPQAPRLDLLCLVLAVAAGALLFAGRVAAPLEAWLRLGAAQGVMTLATLAAAGCAGALAAHVRVATIDRGPVVLAWGEPVTVEGWIVRVDPGERRPRLKILVDAIEGSSAPPRFVTISSHGALPPGRAVRCKAILNPPEPPIAPGGFDGQRRAYFERVGASGFALGACRARAGAAPDALADRIGLRVAAWRRDLTETIAASRQGSGAALAAALVTGDRSLVPADVLAAYRDSGLGHLLSVSGLHMAIVTGMAFGAVRTILALVPPIALRAPAGKIAAGAALVAATAYLVVSGASVPAQRAYVMTAVALGAVLVDRPAFTMRGLAIAACVVVLLAPESVLDPGFQMSFAATGALIAAFEIAAARRGPILPSPGPFIGTLQTGWGLVSSSLLASLVAGLATDLFAVYHFQRIAMYGLAANLVTAPIVSLVVAPAAIAAGALAPFGWSGAPLAVMAWGLDQVTVVAGVFGAGPANVLALPRLAPEAFLCGVAALLVACVFRGALRMLAVAPLCAMIGLAATAPAPIVVAAPDYGVLVVQVSGDEASGIDGPWRSVGPPTGKDFERSRLASLAGAPTTRQRSLAPPIGCHGDFCLWESPHGRLMISVRTSSALAHACRPDAVVIAAETVSPPEGWARTCRLSALLRPNPARGGAAIFETPSGPIVRHALTAEETRPWRASQP